MDIRILLFLEVLNPIFKNKEFFVSYITRLNGNVRVGKKKNHHKI